jgi:mannose-6-phosphate isomerase-like protein (cupin superfamily)
MGIDLARHVLGPDDGEFLEMHGPTAGSIRILVDPTNTGPTGLCTLIQTLNPNAAVPVHRHELAEQVLYFLSGRGTASLGDEQVDATPGMTIHVPKGVRHGIVNTGETALVFLETTSPPGFQETFRKLNELSDPRPEEIGQIAAEYDILMDPDEND